MVNRTEYIFTSEIPVDHKPVLMPLHHIILVCTEHSTTKSRVSISRCGKGMHEPCRGIMCDGAGPATLPPKQPILSDRLTAPR